MLWTCEERGACPLSILPLPCSNTSRHEATPEVWQETFLSSLLRAILYSDDPTYWLEAYRKLDPITNPEGELRFLQATETLFMKGMLLNYLQGRQRLQLCRMAGGL